MTVNIFSGTSYFVDMDPATLGLQEWGSDPSIIAAQLESAKNGFLDTGTNFESGLSPVFDLLQSIGGLKFVIFLTDGQNNLGGYSTPWAVERAQDVGATIFTIGEGTGISSEMLTELATQTGGSYFETPSPNELEAIFSELVGRFVNIYELDYTSEMDLGISRTVRIEVSDGLRIIDEAERSFTPN